MSGDALRFLVVTEYEECRAEFVERFWEAIGRGDDLG